MAFLLLVFSLTCWSLVVLYHVTGSSNTITRNRRSAQGISLDSEILWKPEPDDRAGANIQSKIADLRKAAKSNDTDFLSLGLIAERVRDIIGRFGDHDASDVNIASDDDKARRDDVPLAEDRDTAKKAAPRKERPEEDVTDTRSRQSGKKIKQSQNHVIAENEKNNARGHRRTIVYSCNKIEMCGGWADRQKGIVSAYVLSVLMDRDFKLDMPRPCHLSVYLEPNQVNWTLTTEEARGGQHSRKDLEGIDSHGIDLVNKMLKTQRLDSMADLDADYVFITWNMELVHMLRKHHLARRVPWLAANISLAEIYRNVLKTLFRPSAGLDDMVQRFQRSRPSQTKLVCAQIRMGGSQTFNDSETFNSLDSVMNVIRFMRQYNDVVRYRILFASDNIKTIDMGQYHFPKTFVKTSGPITHVDKHQGNDACAGFGRAILDQTLLSTCDVLVISESGLGKISAFMRNTDSELYLFHDYLITPFRRDMSFPNRIVW